MNKELLSYISIIIALAVGAMYYNNAIQSPMIGALNAIKTSYHGSVEFIQKKINKHIFQAATIEELSEKLQNYENNHLVMQQLAAEINELYSENNSSLKLKPQVSLVRAISYQEFGNFNRLWLDMPDYNSSKIYGLTYKEFVAGIVISKNNKPLALLNKDIKSAYSVFIGENNAPGIAHGNNEEFIVVNFIPSWFEINEGDEVVSSGLDNIFFTGLKVGRVKSVSSSQGYQTAVVEQYYKANETNYFHVIRSVR
ncbi:MAG: rod shape-determining protein MreC [Campylobacterales bacterium]|nr:rod shape-determining protein MreC [Campylobacterales bacterium]